MTQELRKADSTDYCTPAYGLLRGD